MSSNDCTADASEYLQTMYFLPLFKQTWPLLKALINFTSGREAPPKAELVSVVTVNPFVANFFLPKKQEIFAYYGFACEWESS